MESTSVQLYYNAYTTDHVQAPVLVVQSPYYLHARVQT